MRARSFVDNSSMPFDWSAGSLREGLQCYRDRLFFEAHEHWEAVWLAATEPEKTFLQAIIQVAAAFHHLGKGNRVGAMSLLTRALAKLEGYPAEFGGVAVGQLCGDIEGLLAALAAGRTLPGYPVIVQG